MNFMDLEFLGYIEMQCWIKERFEYRLENGRITKNGA